MPKPGRNDLCYCGSGKKYKHCHYKADQKETLSRLNMRRARQSLFARLVDFGNRPRFEADWQSAFNLYWDGRRDSHKKGSLSRDEYMQFAEWFLIDYHTGHDRQRVIDMFRAQAAGYITPEERAYLGAWQSSQFGLYEAVESLAGGVRVEDALRGENSIVQDEIYAPTLNPHELYLGRLAPRDDDAKEFILSLVNVPAAEKEKVIAFGRDKYRLYADAHFGATWSDFLREMNYLFNHYLLDMKGEAPVAAGKVALPTREEFEKAAAIGLVTSEALKA